MAIVNQTQNETQKEIVNHDQDETLKMSVIFY